MEPDAPVVAPATPVTPAPTPSARVALPTLEEITANLTANLAKEGGAPEVAAPDVTPAPVVEPVVAPIVPPVKADPASARFAALAKREKEARARETEAANRLQAAIAREEALTAQAKATGAAKTPLEILKAHGYKYEDATMEAVGAFKPVEPAPEDVRLKSHLDPITAKQAELDESLATVKQAIQQIQSERVEIARRQVQQEIRSTAEKGGYEYIAAIGDPAYTLVHDVIVNYMQVNKGAWLPYEDACAIVEKHYDSQYAAFATTNKVKSRIPVVPQASTTPPLVPTKPLPATPPAKTLTQSHSQATNVKPDLDKLSSREAIDWLAANVLTYAR